MRVAVSGLMVMGAGLILLPSADVTPAQVVSPQQYIRSRQTLQRLGYEVRPRPDRLAQADNPDHAEPEPIALSAKIVTGHEQHDDDGKVLDERKPFDVWERVQLDASSSSGAAKYIWGVFVDFDVSPDDLEGRAPPEVIEAVRRVNSYKGGKASIEPADTSGIIQEYDGGTILDILPIPGTYYVTLTAIANNDGDQVQAVIRVNPYPGTKGPNPSPEPDPVPPPPDELDWSDDVRDWLSTVPLENRTSINNLIAYLIGIEDQPGFDTVSEVETLFSFSTTSLGSSDNVEAWKAFFAEANDKIDEAIADGVTAEELKAAIASIGHGLREHK